MIRGIRSFLVGLSLCAAASTAAAQEKWDMATAYPESNFHTKNARLFAQDVERATDGKLKVTVHGAATLFKANEIKRAVQGGQAQLGEIVISTYANEDPIFGIDGLPGLATSYDEARKLWRVTRPALEARYARQGMRLLYAVAWPPNGIHSVRKIDGPAELKGLKWRAFSPISARIGEIFGSRPVTVQGVELSQALATGVVEAVMTSASTAIDTKMWEYTRFYYEGDWVMVKNAVLVNQKAFDGLPRATQEALLKVAAAAEERGWQMSEDNNRSAKEELGRHNVTITRPPPAFKAEMQRVGDIILSEWLKQAGPDGAAVIDAYRK